MTRPFSKHDDAASEPSKAAVEAAHSVVSKPQFRADIEGLRAIAIILVVAYHAALPGFSGGYIGVDIFFVISGYLITWLLIHEAETTGKVDLIRFYTRRIRRLLPALTVMLLIVSAMSLFIYAPFEQLDLARTTLMTATYRSNLYFSEVAVDYLSADIDTNPLLHTWSLSVEEQFYLVWPLFVILVSGVWMRSRRIFRKQNIFAFIAIAALLSFIYAVHLTSVRQPAAFFLPIPRAWEFLIGAVGLLLPPVKSQRSREFIGWIGFSAILVGVISFNELTSFPGWNALLPAIATVLILWSGASKAPKEQQPSLTRLLSRKPFQKIGKISYSWYLWHWPILVFASALNNGADLPIAIKIVLMTASLLPAIASYYCIENPVRYSKRISAKFVYSAVIVIAFTAGGAWLSTEWLSNAETWTQQPGQARYLEARESRPFVYEKSCHVNFFATEPNLDAACTTGNVNSQTTMLLLGDSHAAQWAQAFEEVAQQESWQFVAMTKSACPYVEATTFRAQLGRLYTECDVWRDRAIAHIQSTKPDRVFLTSAALIYEDLTPDSWLAGAQKVLDKISPASRRVFIIRDTPEPGFHIPVCLARKDWRSRFLRETSSLRALESPCEIQADRETDELIYAAQQEAARQYSNVTVIDMLPYICKGDRCPIEKEGKIVYRDDNHLAASFTSTLVQPLAAQIKAAEQAQEKTNL